MISKDLLEEGIANFNRGEYYWAHELWEDLWRQTAGPRRGYYQGLIQAAVGLHHLTRGNVLGARGLLVRAHENIQLHRHAAPDLPSSDLLHGIEDVLREMKPLPLRITRLK